MPNDTTPGNYIMKGLLALSKYRSVFLIVLTHLRNTIFKIYQIVNIKHKLLTEDNEIKKTPQNFKQFVSTSLIRPINFS